MALHTAHYNRHESDLHTMSIPQSENGRLIDTAHPVYEWTVFFLNSIVLTAHCSSRTLDLHGVVLTNPHRPIPLQSVAQVISLLPNTQQLG